MNCHCGRYALISIIYYEIRIIDISRPSNISTMSNCIVLKWLEFPYLNRIQHDWEERQKVFDSCKEFLDWSPWQNLQEMAYHNNYILSGDRLILANFSERSFDEFWNVQKLAFYMENDPSSWRERKGRGYWKITGDFFRDQRVVDVLKSVRSRSWDTALESMFDHKLTIQQNLRSLKSLASQAILKDLFDWKVLLCAAKYVDAICFACGPQPSLEAILISRLDNLKQRPSPLNG